MYCKSKNFHVTFMDHIHHEHYEWHSLTVVKFNDVCVCSYVSSRGLDDEIEELSCMVFTFITPFGIRV